MLKITIFELFVALIPEAFLFTLGVYFLTQTSVNTKKLMITGLLTGMATYTVRLLPIFPGVNILIVIIITAFLLVAVSRIEIMKVIPSLLLLFIIRLATEFLNVLALNAIQTDLDLVAADPIKKTLSFMPSLVVFALAVLLIYHMKKRKRQVMTDVPG